MSRAAFFVQDQLSLAKVPIDGILTATAGSSPGAGQGVRQTVALGDGVNGDSNFARISADGSLRVADSPASTPNVSHVNSSATAVTLISAGDETRIGTSVLNTSNSPLYIGFDSSVTVANASYVVEPGKNWNCPFRYTGKLTGIWTEADSGQANITTYTI